jgi:hypothetical protein
MSARTAGSFIEPETPVVVPCRRKASQPACKPNSVRRRPGPCGPRLRRNDHSSRPGIARGLQRPTRRLRTGRPIATSACAPTTLPPYLVLLRAGFCLPPPLPAARCALTAPFHPYPPPLRRSRAVSFLCHWSVRLLCPGVTRRTALRSSDFPPALALRAPTRQACLGPACRRPGTRTGDRPAGCDAQLSPVWPIAVRLDAGC